MTPEEKAVIDAAINWLTVGTRAKEFGLCEEERFLTGAVQSLIYTCPKCNAGGHTCPGDGNPISHTATDCGGHEVCGARGMVGASGCVRQVGHDGRHGYADGSGEQDVFEVPRRPTEAEYGSLPRLWRVGDPEPTDVTAVIDCDGDRWEKSSFGEWRYNDLTCTWGHLVRNYGPVREAK